MACQPTGSLRDHPVRYPRCGGTVAGYRRRHADLRPRGPGARHRRQRLHPPGRRDHRLGHHRPESSVWPCAVLRGDDGEIRIGARTSIQDGSVLHTTIEHPTVVGDDCVIGHLVHLEGCTVEDRAMVGNGAIVLHRVVVGTGAVVAANSVVLNDVAGPAGRAGRRRAGHHQARPGPPGRASSTAPGLRRAQPRGSATPSGGSTDAGARHHRPGQRGRAGQRRPVGARASAAIEERAVAPTTPETEDHFVELWTSLGTDVEAITTAAEAFPNRWRWHTVEIDPAVAETGGPTPCRRGSTPGSSSCRRGRSLDVRRRRACASTSIPGAAFGLGDHATTVLTLRLLRRTWWTGATVLDVGCGSGVLSVVAARMGAPYVEAIDISPRPSRRRSTTPSATASPASSRPARASDRRRRRAVRRRAGQPAGAGRRRAGGRPAPGRRRRRARWSSAGSSTASHDHVRAALAPDARRRDGRRGRGGRRSLARH